MRTTTEIRQSSYGQRKFTSVRSNLVCLKVKIKAKQHLEEFNRPLVAIMKGDCISKTDTGVPIMGDIESASILARYLKLYEL